MTIKNQNIKYLSISFLIHSIVFIIFIVFSQSYLQIKPLEEKIIIFELEHIATPNTLVQKPIQQEPIKKVTPQITQQLVVKQEPILFLVEPMVQSIQQISQSQVEQVVLQIPIVTLPPVIKAEPTEIIPLPKVIPPPSTEMIIISKTDFAIIRDKVLANLVYPNIARRMGLQGVVQVALTIDANGKLVSAKIYESSGKPLLDEAALSAALEIKNIQLPKSQVMATLILPIAFKLK